MDAKSKKDEKKVVKKHYRKPKLTVHGTLTKLTRGQDQVHTDGFFSGGTEESSHS